MKRPGRPRPLLLAVLALACSIASVTGAGASMALFGDAAVDAGNGFSTGYWAYFYLHNDPTPPAGDTVARDPLTATTTHPTQATLYDYDTDCDNRAGRQLVRSNPPSPDSTAACHYVSWRLPPQAGNLALPAGSTVEVHLWSATDTNAPRRTGAIIAYLRDFDPSTGTYSEVSSATVSADYSSGRTFYETTISVPIASSRTIPAGHQLEVKVESPRSDSQNDMLVAYDTTDYPSFLGLP